MCLPVLDGVISRAQLQYSQYSQLNMRVQQSRKAEDVNIFYLPKSHGLSLPFCEMLLSGKMVGRRDSINMLFCKHKVLLILSAQAQPLQTSMPWLPSVWNSWYRSN